MIDNFNTWSLNEASVTTSMTRYQSNIITFIFKRNKIEVFRKYGRQAKILWFQIDNTSKFIQINDQTEDFIISVLEKILEHQNTPTTTSYEMGIPGSYGDTMYRIWLEEHNLPEIIESDPRLKKWWERVSRNKKFGL